MVVPLRIAVSPHALEPVSCADVLTARCCSRALPYLCNSVMLKTRMSVRTGWHAACCPTLQSLASNSNFLNRFCDSLETSPLCGAAAAGLDGATLNLKLCLLGFKPVFLPPNRYANSLETSYDAEELQPDWEVDPSTLEIGPKVGQGEFGTVHKVCSAFLLIAVHLGM